MDNPNAYPPMVEKGQILTIPELEIILGVKYPHPKWWSKLLRLRDRIYRDRTRRQLPQLTIRTEHFELVVCTDSEAATYNRGMGKRGLRRLARATERNLSVDTTKLSDDEKKSHQITLNKQAMFMRAIRTIQHGGLPTISPPPERTTPKMIVQN